MAVCYAYMLGLRSLQLGIKMFYKENVKVNLIEIGLLLTTLFVFLLFWLITKKSLKAIKWLCMTINVLEGAYLVLYRHNIYSNKDQDALNKLEMFSFPFFLHI